MRMHTQKLLPIWSDLRRMW